MLFLPADRVEMASQVCEPADGGYLRDVVAVIGTDAAKNTGLHAQGATFVLPVRVTVS